MSRLAIPFPINDFTLQINNKTTFFHIILIKVFTYILNNTNLKEKVLYTVHSPIIALLSNLKKFKFTLKYT